MVKTIKLATGLYDDNIYILAENDNLQIKLKGNIYPNANYYFKANNGEKEFNLLFNDNTVEINPKDLVFGELKAKIVIMLDNKVINEYRVENLIIQKLDNKIKVIPQFEEFEKKFDKKLYDCYSNINKIKDNQVELEEKYKRIEEFANEIEQLKKLVYVMCNIGGNENE